MTTFMNWAQLMSSTRFKVQDNEIIPMTPTHNQKHYYRTPFHIDHDRLVFSNAFRRLGRKTQVHPLAKHDHTHNRLTHSVEVASVGRSLGRAVGGMLAERNRLPKNIDVNDFGIVVQVACLAHDLGNPPFGHTGEEALRQWFRHHQNSHYLIPLSDAERNDIQTYEGNAHSLRQIANLEMYGKHGGMRLTAASVGSILKYPWTSSKPKYGRNKFNIYQTELPYIRQIAKTLNLPETSHHCWARHPLSYLMEAADDICYALMDLEDAIDLELLDYSTVYDVLRPLIKPNYANDDNPNPRDKLAMMRGHAIGQAIENLADLFIENEITLLNGTFPHQDLLAIAHDNVQLTLNQAKKLARDKIFRHHSKIMHELAAFSYLGSILDLLIPAVYTYITSGSLNKQQSLALELLKPITINTNHTLYQAYMCVLDYIGAMTDNHAAQVARELSGISMS